MGSPCSFICSDCKTRIEYESGTGMFCPNRDCGRGTLAVVSPMPLMPSKPGWYWWRLRAGDRDDSFTSRFRREQPVHVHEVENARTLMTSVGGYVDDLNYEWGERIPDYYGAFVHPPDDDGGTGADAG